MKEIRVEIPENQLEVLDDFVQSSNIKYSQIQLKSDSYLFILTIPDNLTNNLLHELKARGVGDVFGSISLIPLSLYIDSSQSKSTIKKSTAANLEEILANIEDSAILSITYVALVILSGALAAFGLLSNSVVIIIGSMIVAPLMGPIALTSIGVLLPQRGLLKKGLIAESFGILATIAVGYIIGFIMKKPETIPEEMQIRASADPLNIIFAIISALAAGVIISKGQSLSIVGVAIAASLAPPAANIGLYLSFGLQHEAELSANLLLINILAINASCSIMFSIFRLPSKSGLSKRRATKVERMNRIIIFIVAIAFVILSVITILNSNKG